jgi:hypothetical protein
MRRNLPAHFFALSSAHLIGIAILTVLFCKIFATRKVALARSVLSAGLF